MGPFGTKHSICDDQTINVQCRGISHLMQELVMWFAFYLKCPVYPFSEVNKEKIDPFKYFEHSKSWAFRIKNGAAVANSENDPISGKSKLSRLHGETLFQQMFKHGIGCCQKDFIIISFHKEVKSKFRLKISAFIFFFSRDFL